METKPRVSGLSGHLHFHDFIEPSNQLPTTETPSASGKGSRLRGHYIHTPNPVSPCLGKQVPEHHSPFQASQTNSLTQSPQRSTPSTGLPGSSGASAPVASQRAPQSCLHSPGALQHSRKDTFEKKIVFIGTHLNIRYTWCWLARTVCTFDIDGAKTKTVTGHDGERC